MTKQEYLERIERIFDNELLRGRIPTVKLIFESLMATGISAEEAFNQACRIGIGKIIPELMQEGRL